MKTIGIIGGMGPAATIDLYQKYVNRDTLKNFDYENLNLLKSISSSELRLVIDHFNNKKSNLF